MGRINFFFYFHGRCRYQFIFFTFLGVSIFFFFLLSWVRGRRQAHNPTLAKIMRLAYNRSHSHNRPQTAACNAVYSISRRALMITRLGEQLPRPRQVSMLDKRAQIILGAQHQRARLWDSFSLVKTVAKLPATLGGCVQYRGHLRKGTINRVVLDTVQK
jgi:hypothetical protein